MSTFNDLPLDIHSNMICRIYDARTLSCFGRTANRFYNLICEIAAYVHPNLSFDNNNVTISFNNKDNCFNLFVLYKQSMNFFTLNPVCMVDLTNAKDLTGQDDLPFLCNHANENSNCSLQQSIVIFDYTKKTLTGVDLALALQTDAFQPNLPIAEAVFIHPNANEIPGDDAARPLTDAIAAKKTSLVRKILAHPNLSISDRDFADAITAAIHAKDDTSLKKLFQLPAFKELSGENLANTITAAIEANHREALSILFTQDNAASIPISKPLTAAIRAENEETIEILLSILNTKGLQGGDIFEPASAAIEKGHLKVLDILLGLTQASNIPPHHVAQMLSAAFKAKIPGLVEKLLDHPTIEEIDIVLLPLLMVLALRENHQQAFQRFLSLFDETVMPYGLLSVLSAATQEKNQEAIDMLLSRIDLEQIHGHQLVKPLNAAIKANDQKLIRLLLDHLKVIPSYEFSVPLTALIETKNPGLLQMFLSHPATIQIIGNDTAEELSVAIQEDNSERIKQLLDKLNEEDEVQVLDVTDFAQDEEENEVQVLDVTDFTQDEEDL